MPSDGTVLITGANGSLAIPAVDHLLGRYPHLTAILAVRNAAPTDANTRKLRDTIARHPGAKASVHELDLTSLAGVHGFANIISAAITEMRYPPLKAILCNATYWNLVDGPETTEDGFDKTFQVGHIAHVALVMRLLGSFAPDGGRVQLFSCESHIPGKAVMGKLPPSIPEDLDLLAYPPTAKGDTLALGSLRYGNVKRATASWVYLLNRYLEKDPSLSHINAVAFNPGVIVDSRAFRTNVPWTLPHVQRFVCQPFLSLIRRLNKETRTAAEAGPDAIEFAVGSIHPGKRGYLDLLGPESSPKSRGVATQDRLWEKSLKWAGITRENTALKSAFG